MLAIVDYGMGNLRSVQRALERGGHHAIITSDPQVVADADKIVLPGVGAFRDAIAKLRTSGLDEPILEHVRRRKPFFGICLGMQLLFAKSYEDGEYDGLGVFPGEVIRFRIPTQYKIPHMGWNQLRVLRRAPEIGHLQPNDSVYFVHSYHVVPRDHAIVATETDYPTPFVSSIWHENVFATQFHPEKSQRVGMAMLHAFAERK